MKTISKRCLALSVAVAGFVGCSPSNDSNAMTSPTGQAQTGVTSPDAIKDPKKFADTNKSPITDPAKYKSETK